MVNPLTKSLIKLTTNLTPISVGTKFFPTNSLETEYVELFNYTQTILFELDKAEITSDSILENLIRDVGGENLPKDYNFYELKPAENRIEEYALVSNIIMGNDRYFYIELQNPSNLINVFVKIIENEKGEVVEKTETELVAKMLSKNDAIRVAIELIGIGLSEGSQVISAVGMTGAASIERAIHYTQHVGSFPGIAFTKLGGEYALVFDSPFLLRESKPLNLDNYLFIDLIDSTKFIDKNGRNQLVDLMTGIKNFIETECDGELEGYREGGDDFIARFPSKDLAIRALRDEKLGTDAFTDFLAVEFSVKLPNEQGNSLLSAEKEDIYLRLDRELRALLEAIEISVGLDNTLVMVAGTAQDPYSTKELASRQIASGQFNAKRSMALLNAYLMAIYGQGRYISGYYTRQIYLNQALITNKKIDRNQKNFFF